jgi:hypothetical protein
MHCRAHKIKGGKNDAGKIFTAIVLARCFACASALAGQEQGAELVSDQTIKESKII